MLMSKHSFLMNRSPIQCWRSKRLISCGISLHVSCVNSSGNYHLTVKNKVRRITADYFLWDHSKHAPQRSVVSYPAFQAITFKFGEPPDRSLLASFADYQAILWSNLNPIIATEIQKKTIAPRHVSPIPSTDTLLYLGFHLESWIPRNEHAKIKQELNRRYRQLHK